MFGSFGKAMGAGARNIGRGMAGGPVNTAPGGAGGQPDYGRGGKMGAGISGGLGALASKFGDPQIGGPAPRSALGNMQKPFQMNVPQIPMMSGLPQGQMPGQQMPLPQAPPPPPMGGINTGPSPEMMPQMPPQFGGLPPGMGGFRGSFGGQQQDPRFRF